MNTFKEYILGEAEVEKGDLFVGMPPLKWEKHDPFMILLKGEFLNCQSKETRQKMKDDMASGRLNKTQMARVKKQAIEFIGSVVNASMMANQYSLSIPEYAKQMTRGSGALLAQATDETSYFICAHRSTSGFEAKAVLPVKDLKNVQSDMQKVLVSELKTGKNPFLCLGRSAKPSDIVVPKPTKAMLDWVGTPMEKKD